MRKLLVIVAILILLVVVTGCGSPAPEPSTEDTAPAGQAEAGSEQVVATPTRVVLATPTPRPAPPTPTLNPPTPTPVPPTPSPESEAEQTAEVEPTPTEEPPPPAPAVTDIMVEIPAGPFIMGSNVGDFEDAPAHEVDLPAYEIDKFEVTNADFAVFVEETGYVTFAAQQGYRTWRDEWDEGEDNHPVVIVTWDDAVAYCTWLGKRLPSEAEWEKAASWDPAAEQKRRYPWGDEWDPDKANVKERELRGTAVVGSFGAGASPYGAEDMIGNVWEWTAGWYQAYPGNTTADPSYGETFRVTRGGGWFDLQPQGTTFNRNAADPQKTAIDELGFRCAR